MDRSTAETGIYFASAPFLSQVKWDLPHTRPLDFRIEEHMSVFPVAIIGAGPYGSLSPRT